MRPKSHWITGDANPTSDGLETMPKLIRWFNEIGLSDVGLVGGKNASLGEMYRELSPLGIKVPNGFAITADAYRYVLDSAEAWPRLHEALDGLNPNDVADLARRGHLARDIVYGALLPDDLQTQILDAYHKLIAEYGAQMTVAVRSSATAEDLPTASFAGQHATYLNVSGDALLLDAVRRCFASLFMDRAIHYRVDQGFDHFKVFLSVGVMKMVRSDLGASGVAFTLDTETGFRDVVFLTGAYGIGENIVQGAVDPDEFYVHKPTFEQGYRAVLRRTLGSKKIKMVYGQSGVRDTTRNVPTSAQEREAFCMSDPEVLALAGACILVEKHYSAKAGHAVAMDVEWAKDGLDGSIYLVQARPETSASQRSALVIEEYAIQAGARVLASGRAVGTKVAAGKARIVKGVQDLGGFQKGEVLVAETTTPDWEPVMKTAAAIVTNRGGRTCHAAIVARELGIPAVVGTGDAMQALADRSEVTVSCAEGDVGKIYDGSVPFEIHRFDVSSLRRPKTKIMMNVGDPDAAFGLAALPNDGVGLARMEFVISNSIKVHPMALLHPEKLSAQDRDLIAALTRGFATPADFFIQRLSEGVGTIAAAFYPKPVIARMSDFKTNEYANLIGGRAFEPVEDNPMLGFRGASRYAHPAYAEGFALECSAMKRVREVMGLTNLVLMIPFCRRVDEGERVVQKMAELGLRRADKGLEIYVMCEIPNNVVQIDAFSKVFDGFSIGSNDLTQLVLGVDRDSELVAFDYDERDAGVLDMIRAAVEGARRNGRHSGICGQAPSDYPEIAEFLVRIGIDSISLNPDSIVKTTLGILEVEAQNLHPIASNAIERR
jgi:pyruvate,water dikinase